MIAEAITDLEVHTHDGLLRLKDNKWLIPPPKVGVFRVKTEYSHRSDIV